MRLAIIATAILLVTPAASSSAVAKTATGTIKVSAQIVPGYTVSSYVTKGGEIETTVRHSGQMGSAGRSQGAPVIAVSFETQPSWYLVKYVTFDKARHLLIVNF
ncbi:MAG: hypothetical protein ACXVAK_10855 [Vulcanimicrobiaceae bacterium]